MPADRHGPLPDSNLIAHPLIATRYFACASERLLQRLGRPDTPEDLARFPCLAFPLPISAVYPSRKQVPRKVKLLVEFLRRRLTHEVASAPSLAQVR